MENNNKSSNARDSVILAVSIIIVCRLMWKFLNRVAPNPSTDEEPTEPVLTDVKPKETNTTDKKSEKKTKNRLTHKNLKPVIAGTDPEDYVFPLININNGF